ncbi:MAG: hypothetical protein IH623_10255 [Verrucomicrobia bacterium]|nr:hypothetical protein [Verrucomicrobiota bacterium]
MKEQEDHDHWKQWMEHWRFSNQTSYRISEELERLTTAWINDFGLPPETESVILVRHPLLSTKEEENFRKEHEQLFPAEKRVALQQFTQSATFGKLFSPETQAKAVADLEKNVGALVAFLTDVNNPQRMVAWEGLLKAVKDSARSFVEEEIDFALLAKPKDWERVDPEKKPALIGSIYQIFIHTSHKGFLADNLDEWIFKQSTSKESKTNPINSTNGYLIVTQPDAQVNELPKIKEVWRITAGGHSPEDIFSEISDHKDQKLEWIIGSGDDDLHVYFTLWSTLFTFFNESLASPETKSMGMTREIHHIVIPVFRWSLSQRAKNTGAKAHHRGGILLGWIFQRSLEKPPWWPGAAKTVEKTLSVMDLVSNLSLRVERFAENYLSGETEWALEREWKSDDTAASYMIKNYFHSCGWDCKEFKSAEMSTYVGEWDANEQSLKVNLSRKVPTGGANQSASQSLVAYLKPNSLCIIPDDETARTAYLTSVAEHARYFYCDRCLAVEKQREALRLFGFLASAHDYSKQVGAAGTRLYEYDERLTKVKKWVEECSGKIQSTASLGDAKELAVRIDAAVRDLHDSRVEWFDVVQFNLDHLHARTQGAQPLNSPASCVGFVEQGTKRSLYALINRLVWLPLDYEGYKGIEETSRRHAPDKLDNPLTWANLFQYDTGAEPGSAIHEKLGRRISKLILNEKITQNQFWERFPVPVINRSLGMDGDIIWSKWPAGGHSAHLKPVIGLLPLLVFSLRLAYQCAWSRTLMEEKCEHAIEIQPEYVEDKSAYRIHIQFPAPIVHSGIDVNRIPYCLEWKRQLDHYRGGKVYPWSVTDAITPLPIDRLELFLEAKL